MALQGSTQTAEGEPISDVGIRVDGQTILASLKMEKDTRNPSTYAYSVTSDARGKFEWSVFQGRYQVGVFGRHDRYQVPYARLATANMESIPQWNSEEFIQEVDATSPPSKLTFSLVPFPVTRFQIKSPNFPKSNCRVVARGKWTKRQAQGLTDEHGNVALRLNPHESWRISAFDGDYAASIDLPPAAIGLDVELPLSKAITIKERSTLKVSDFPKPMSKRCSMVGFMKSKRIDSVTIA